MGGISARSPSSTRNYTSRVSRTWTSPRRRLPHRHPRRRRSLFTFPLCQVPSKTSRGLSARWRPTHSRPSHTPSSVTEIRRHRPKHSHRAHTRERPDTRRAACPAGLTPLYAPIITTEPVSPQSRDTSDNGRRIDNGGRGQVHG